MSFGLVINSGNEANMSEVPLGKHSDNTLLGTAIEVLVSKY